MDVVPSLVKNLKKVELTEKQTMDLVLGNVPEFVKQILEGPYMIHDLTNRCFNIDLSDTDRFGPLFNYAVFWEDISEILSKTIDIIDGKLVTFSKETYDFIQEYSNLLGLDNDYLRINCKGKFLGEDAYKWENIEYYSLVDLYIRAKTEIINKKSNNC